jgi:integrase
VEYNYQATDKIVRTAAGKTRMEWRISGVDGLVLVTQPTGTATWYFFYRDKATGKAQKHRIGEYVPESEWKRHKGAAGNDPSAPPILTLAEARRVAEEQRHAVQDGTDPVALKRARANAMSFKQLAEKFLEEAPHLAAKTRRAYRYALEKDVYPAIGAMPAADVTPDHVLGVCKSIEAREIVTVVNGKKLKRNPRIQSQRTKTTIGGVFKWAKDNGYGNVKTNPARDVTPRAGVTRRKRTPTDDELAALWKATERKAKLSQSMRLIVQLSVLTAQRRDEIAGARKSELRGLDTDSPTWIIPGDETRRGLLIEGRTKNGREQHVPLSNQSAELFRKAIKLSDDQEYVFPADLSKVKIGRKPRTPHINGDSVTMAVRRIRLQPIADAENTLRAVERALASVERAGNAGDLKVAREALDAAKARLKEAKPLFEDLTIHDMRRACSSWLKNQGVSREVRDLVLNHLDPSVTERHYSAEARMEEQVKAAFQAWADHVSVVIGRPAQASNVVPLQRAAS